MNSLAGPAHWEKWWETSLKGGWIRIRIRIWILDRIGPSPFQVSIMSYLIESF